MRLIDEMIIDLSPHADKFEKQYDKKFHTMQSKFDIVNGIKCWFLEGKTQTHTLKNVRGRWLVTEMKKV